jgi:hypothetical protein
MTVESPLDVPEFMAIFLGKSIGNIIAAYINPVFYNVIEYEIDYFGNHIIEKPPRQKTHNPAGVVNNCSPNGGATPIFIGFLAHGTVPLSVFANCRRLFIAYIQRDFEMSWNNAI